MGMKLLLFAAVFLLPILGGPAEVEGFISFAAKTMTRLKMRLDARLRPDKDDDVPFMVSREGYPVETHQVITEDGYILRMHRIPYSKRSPRSDGGERPAVYIQHGLTSSSADWLVAGPKKALGYVLADNGYDVWLGNYRGNRYSRRHLTLDPDSLWNSDFWQFSWDQAGYYDIPAMIDHVLNVTGQDSLQYVGFSMGTTGFMVAANEHQEEIADKVKMAHLVAPVAYVQYMRTPLVAILPISNFITKVLEEIGYDEWVPNGWLISTLGRIMCPNDVGNLCSNFMFLMAGFNQAQMNYTLLPEVVKGTPAGASTKMVAQYAQNARAGKFQKFDFGGSRNMKIYGQSDPPEYKVENVKVPVATYWGENDYLASKEDYFRMLKEFPMLYDNFTVPYPEWNHLDFMWAIDTDVYFFPRILKNMEAAEKLEKSKNDL